ncbi:hypothetical protein [Nocardia sp. NPDC049149]|uniref:WXG100 family type VII secretion target n=1 Tax=Nocardia sp. NPDC049149 TaxID=3364315 RepID=UPI00371558A6
MSDAVQVDPDQLRERGARLADIGDQVGQTYTQLRDALAYAEGSWGDDDMGLAFAKEFKPHADQLLANLDEMAASLRSTTAGIVDAAGQFETQDQLGADRAHYLSRSNPIAGPVPAWPGDNAGTPTPMGIQSAGTDTAGFPPTGWPAQGPPATDRPEQRGEPGPAASRSPETSSKPSTPQRNPSPDAPGRAAGPEAEPRAAGPFRAPPGRFAEHARPATVFPPAGTEEAPRTTAARQVGGSGEVGRRGVPWSGLPTTPSGPPAATESSPQHPRSAPARPATPRNEPARDRPRPGPAQGKDPVIGWLARMLADRHGVQVTGFDMPGLQVPAVREFVAAVDRVLSDYPAIELDVVAVADLDTGSGPVWWSPGTRAAGGGLSITLDQRSAQGPTRSSRTAVAETETAVAGTETAAAETETAEREIYCATLRQFGRALDHVGGGRARKQAHRVLIAEYLRLTPRHRTLAEELRGFRAWRAELSGDADEFDVDSALGAAFAAVVQHGAEASRQARVLHTVLIDATSG